MELNQTLQKIKKLMDERDWTLYRLAKNADIPCSSLSSLFQKNNQPTISTLEKICNGFHISLHEFFSDYPPCYKESDTFTKEELHLIESVRSLSKRNQKLVYDFVKLLERH